MSNYTKSTNFATKDNLSSGNPLKIVKGTELDTEFNNIHTSIETKADLASPAFTGSPSLPTGTTGVTQSAGNNSTALATTAFVTAANTALINTIYPVGAIFTSVVSTSPATLFGVGSWSAFGTGRMLIGIDSGNSLFNTVEETGGTADAIVVSHSHTATSTVTDPGHAHTFAGAVNPGGSGSDRNGVATTKTTDSAVTGITVATSISTVGSSGTNANYPPFIAVYMWKRTA
jgi:hypothetical protein